MKKMTGKNTLMLFFDRIYLGNSFCSTERGDGLYRALYIYLCTLFNRWDFSDSMYLFSGQMACEK